MPLDGLRLSKAVGNLPALLTEETETKKSRIHCWLATASAKWFVAYAAFAAVAGFAAFAALRNVKIGLE